MFTRDLIVGGSLGAGSLIVGLPGDAPEPVDPNIPPSTVGLIMNLDLIQQPIAGEGDPLPTLTDYSGSSNDAVQSSPALQATATLDLVGSGLPAARFAGSAYELPAALKLDPTQPFTILLAQHRPDRNVTACWISWTNSGAAAGYALFQISLGRASARVGGTSSGNTATDSWPAMERAVVDLRSEGVTSSFAVRYNEVQIGTAFTGTTSPDPARKVFLGGGDDGTGTPQFLLTGDLHQMLVYDRALSPAEMTATVAWLKDRWSLP